MKCTQDAPPQFYDDMFFNKHFLWKLFQVYTFTELMSISFCVVSKENVQYYGISLLYFFNIEISHLKTGLKGKNNKSVFILSQPLSVYFIRML